jgi:membrane associated rhomboid family serine protease
MPRLGASSFSFPAFSGATRLLVLVNLAAFFVLLLAGALAPQLADGLYHYLTFAPSMFIHGALWQPFTYSFIHSGITGTLFELISLWLMAGFLEQMHNESWITGLYISSVLGTAAAALAIFAVSSTLGFPLLTIIYGLISIAMLFGEQRMYAFAQLGGALAGLLFIQFGPRRGMGFVFSEKWYGLRNRYYRWKRRRAARKFEVYMRSQGRTVRFDGQGRQLDEDPDDKKRWN